MRGRRREPLAPILVAGPEARSARPVSDRVLSGCAVEWWYDGGSAAASSTAAGYDTAAAAASAGVGVDRRERLERRHRGGAGGLDRDGLRSGEQQHGDGCQRALPLL